MNMKRVIIILLVLCSLVGKGQDSTRNNKSKGNTKDTVQKMYYLILPEQTWSSIITLIKSADEKPSVIKSWLDLIGANIRQLNQQSIQTNAKPKK